MLVLSPVLLTATLAKGFSNALAVDMMVLMGWAALNIASCLTIAAIVATLFRVPRSFRDEFLVGCAFQNAFTAPVMMVRHSICHAVPSTPHHAQACFQRRRGGAQMHASKPSCCDGHFANN
jgi:predicted permease